MVSSAVGGRGLFIGVPMECFGAVHALPGKRGTATYADGPGSLPQWPLPETSRNLDSPWFCLMAVGV